MKPLTISRKKSGPNVSPLFNMLCSTLNPHPYQVVGEHCYLPFDGDPLEYSKCGESGDREYFKLKTQ
jgi:hypothetical protein